MFDFISFVLSLPIRFISLLLSIPLAVIGKGYDLLFKKKPEEPHTILITGASSGICKEIALQYAKPGNRLFLIARNRKRLESVAALAKEKGAEVEIASIDATNAKQLSEYIQQQDKAYPIDLVIAGVGVVSPPNASSMSLSELYDFLIEANITTCKNTILPIIDPMRLRRRGQICILSSVAGLGINFISPMYSACKMSIYAFGESLRIMLSPYGVYVNIVCPGYTDTPILDTNTGKNVSYKLSAEDVAKMTVDGLKRDYAVIECNMLYNLITSFIVRDLPKFARDYMYRLVFPLAKRYGFFTNEYPHLDEIYKEKSAFCVCFKTDLYYLYRKSGLRFNLSFSDWVLITTGLGVSTIFVFTSFFSISFFSACFFFTGLLFSTWVISGRIGMRGISAIHLVLSC